MQVQAISSRVPYPWFKLRKYVHFDMRMNEEEACSFVSSPERVAVHPFLPFITFTLGRRRKKKEGGYEEKTRQVAIASHRDSHVFAYYSHILSQRYETVIRDQPLSGAVLAYRKLIPAKCNIQFALDAIGDIRRRGVCAVIALDIKSFFDTIPHSVIKAQWTQLLGSPRLPDDHYAVYRAITGFARVEREALYGELRLSEASAAKLHRLCTAEQFRSQIRGKGLIKRNSADNARGIPQGAPLSAFLSNLAMLDIDRQMVNAAGSSHCSYRRYSDDILLIGDEKAVDVLLKRLTILLAELSLEINPAKTQKVTFSGSPNDHKVDGPRPLQYLGFTYDGRNIRIRASSLSRYYIRMMSAADRALAAAAASKRRGGDGRVHREDLYARYTHLRRRRRRSKESGGRRLSSFVTYALRAGSELKSPAIGRQLRKHWSILEAKLGNSHPADQK